MLWPLINGIPRILGEMNNLYMAPPPTGYGVGISGIGSRVAYVPQMQDYEYGDLGYDPTVGTSYSIQHLLHQLGSNHI